MDTLDDLEGIMMDEPDAETMTKKNKLEEKKGNNMVADLDELDDIELEDE